MEQNNRHLIFTFSTALLFFFGLGAYATKLLYPYTPAYLTANIPFFALGLGLFFSHTLILKNPLSSLVTETTHWSWKRALLIGISYTLILTLFTLISALVHRSDYHFISVPFSKRLGFILMALIVTPLQTSGEEILFRIIPLKLTKRIRSTILRALIPTTIFTVLHFANREVAQSQNQSAVFLYYAFFGFLPSYIALKTQRYEFPLAVHAANNLFIAIICNYEYSSLPSIPLFFSTRPIGTWLDLLQLAVALGVGYLIVTVTEKADLEESA